METRVRSVILGVSIPILGFLLALPLFPLMPDIAPATFALLCRIAGLVSLCFGLGVLFSGHLECSLSLLALGCFLAFLPAL